MSEKCVWRERERERESTCQLHHPRIISEAHTQIDAEHDCQHAWRAAQRKSNKSMFVSVNSIIRMILFSYDHYPFAACTVALKEILRSPNALQLYIEYINQ